MRLLFALAFGFLALLSSVLAAENGVTIVGATITDIEKASGAVSVPKLFAPEVDWGVGSYASPAFTPDGQTVFFTRATGATRMIMVSHLRDHAWTKPEVASFSGTWRDIEPAMAPDGSYLVFISNRPAAAEGQPLTGFFGGASRPGMGGNVWRVNREGQVWGDPVRLSDVVNSHSAIYSPAVAQDGSLYFNQPDPVTKKSHIYRAQSTSNGFLPPVPLPFNHGEVGDFDAAVAPDESFIVFSSARTPAQANQAVLFISYAKNGLWTEPEAFQPVVVGLEARLSPDLKTLYFSAEVPPSNAAPAASEAVPSRIFQLPLSEKQVNRGGGRLQPSNK
jgi:WD40-like Beta Propeller Repeat